MALVTVEGSFQEGKIELAERPEGVGEGARVLVTFLPAGPNPGPTPEEVRREAGKRLLAFLDEGLPLGGPPYPSREELYERVNLFDAARPA